MARRRDPGRGTRLTLIALIGVVCLLVAGFVWLGSTAIRVDSDWLRANQATVFATPKPVVSARLLDKDGRPFDRSAFRGQWSLLFYGYTFCPDVCPTTLSTLRDALAALPPPDKRRPPVGVFLVTVDPARDSPAQLKAYVEHFNPAFGGITGDINELARFAASTDTRYSRNEDGSYRLDHSANLVLIDPRGEYAGYIAPPFDSARIAQVVDRLRRAPVRAP